MNFVLSVFNVDLNSIKIWMLKIITYFYCWTGINKFFESIRCIKSYVFTERLHERAVMISICLSNESVKWSRYKFFSTLIYILRQKETIMRSCRKQFDVAECIFFHLIHLCMLWRVFEVLNVSQCIANCAVCAVRVWAGTKRSQPWRNKQQWRDSLTCHDTAQQVWLCPWIACEECQCWSQGFQWR